MKLTLALLFKKLPNGNIFRGKHQLNSKIRWWMQRELRDDIAREEKNMEILRHHFLTKEQVKGYSYDLGKEAAFITKMRILKRANFPKDICLEDQLGFLRQKDSWDKYY